MAFIQLSGVALSFGARDIIRNATLNLQAGSRAALTGPNGAGKSTLMKIAAGLLKPDAGDVIISKGARVVYLPQTGIRFEYGTVHDIAEEGFRFFRNLVEEQERIGRQLESSGLSEKETARLLDQHHEIGETLENAGYWRREEKIADVLRGLDFKHRDFDRPAVELSGGWQMRLALARILLEDPDIMLLDEPTNYLDLEARTWLENFLKDYRGAVLVVSHDRYFLDVTVREVYELFSGTLTRYAGTYSQYEARRSQELAALFEAWERQQEEIQRIEDFIRRFRYKESKAPQVQSRIKMLEKITPIEIPEGMKRIHFSFPPAPRSGQVVVRIRDLSKAYGNQLVIGAFSLEVERGQKLALVGPNGAGKSTLMRLVSGSDPYLTGSISLGANVQIGYFSQESAELMESSATVEEEAASVCPPDMLPKLRNLLGAFLFRDDDIEKPISVLSGGERSRLALLKLLLKPSNLLVLDEPTNHLDLTSKDILLEALKKYEGTVIFVSHDRQFLDELADRVLELSCGTSPRLYHGNYAYYLEKKAQEAAGETLSQSAFSRPVENVGQNSPPVTDWENEKARKAHLRKLKRREEEISTRIGAIAAEKQQLQEQLAHPATYMNGEKTRATLASIEALEQEAENLNEEWMEIAEMLSAEES
jgi:ATP-binding cassette subfamily F protein 3